MFIDLNEDFWINLAHVVKIDRKQKTNGVLEYRFYDINGGLLGKVDSQDAGRFNSVKYALDSFGQPSKK